MTSPQIPSPATLSPEQPLHKLLRMSVGIMLAIQSVVFFFIACFIGIMTVFLGGMAFLAGAGGATDQQIKTTGYMLLLTVVSPFVWTMMIVLSSINILLRKRPWLVVVFCVLSIVSEIGISYYVAAETGRRPSTPANYDSFKIFGIVTMLIPFAGVVVAFMMRRGARGLKDNSQY